MLCRKPGMLPRRAIVLLSWFTLLRSRRCLLRYRELLPAWCGLLPRKCRVLHQVMAFYGGRDGVIPLSAPENQLTGHATVKVAWPVLL
jgi:hypothetical protein